MTSLPGVTRTLLASYPPSFRARYGAEQVALIEDVGAKGTTLDLATGSLRAWLRPALGPTGPERTRLRLTATISTVWVMWVAAFFGGLVWFRATGDPYVRALNSPWGFVIYRWIKAGWMIGVIATALIVAAAFVITLVAARRTGFAQALRPLRGFALYVAIMCLSMWLLALVRHSHYARTLTGTPSTEHIRTWYLIALGAWVLALIPLAIVGARAPLVVLRHVELPTRELRLLAAAGTIPVLALTVVGFGSVTFSVYEFATRQVESLPIDVVAAVGLVLVSIVALVSYVRVMPVTFRSPISAD